MVDIWSHSIIIAGKRAAQLESRFVEIRFFETVWKRAHRSIGATCDSIVSNRWTRFEHLDCVDGLSNPVNHNAAAAVSYVGIIDILKENPFVLTIAPTRSDVDIPSKRNPTPIPCTGDRSWSIRIEANRFIQPRGEVNASGGNTTRRLLKHVSASVEQRRRTQNLQCSPGSIDVQARATDTQPRTSNFENCPRIDHRGDPHRDIHRQTICENGSRQETNSNLVRNVVANCFQSAVATSVADDSHDITRQGRGKRVGDSSPSNIVKRTLQAAVRVRTCGFVNENVLADHVNQTQRGIDGYRSLALQYDAAAIHCCTDSQRGLRGNRTG